MGETERKSWRRRFGRRALLLVGIFIALLTIPLWGCHGHRIDAELVPNHDETFDFCEPPCSPEPEPATDEDDLLVHYLGVGGLYFEWRGAGLLTAPFFSNYSMPHTALGQLRADEEAIRKGLNEILDKPVRHLLVGHSHYDHLGDVPHIMQEHFTQAKVWVNESGSRMLRAYPELKQRIVTIEQRDNDDYTWLPDSTDPDWPIRFKPIPSKHAPHVCGILLSGGKTEKQWKHWCRPPLAMKAGQPYAFLIDFMDGEEVRFRVHYQDSASSYPHGVPSKTDLEERNVDLAVTCLASSWLVHDYPEKLIRDTKARHALIGHYEDFFRPPDEPLRFAFGLRDSRARRFIERVEDTIPKARANGPEPCTCGPCGKKWTMPLPGEWLRFRTDGLHQ